ncbi:MAG: hypothetical protein H9802_12840 [Candidatus Phocaeicola faecipullorum]|nr:hypothetical protein [Candidatus Phocaeicola faecipullorum]
MKKNKDTRFDADFSQFILDGSNKGNYPFFELESEKDSDIKIDSEEDLDFEFDSEESLDDTLELEHIDNYRLQFFELPEIFSRFDIVGFDKKDLEVNLMINDCKYDEIDKIEFKYGKVKEFDYTLLDFSKIELECPEALYMLALKDRNKEIYIFTFEISENKFCLGKLEKGRHNNMGFYNKLPHEEFIDLCTKKI